MSRFTESDVEQAALAWLEAIGWQIAHGPDISPDGDTLTLALSQGERGIALTLPLAQRERESYGEVVLAHRLRQALARLNPDLPAEAPENVFCKLTRPAPPAAPVAGAQAGVKERGPIHVGV